MNEDTYTKAFKTERETEAREDSISDQIGAAITARRRAREAGDHEEVERLTAEIARLQAEKDSVWNS